MFTRLKSYSYQNRYHVETAPSFIYALILCNSPVSRSNPNSQKGNSLARFLEVPHNKSLVVRIEVAVA